MHMVLALFFGVFFVCDVPVASLFSFMCCVCVFLFFVCLFDLVACASGLTILDGPFGFL